MSIFRARLHITEKATRRTWISFWPHEDGIAFYAATGSKRTVIGRAGYSEYNDQGEPVLDSWIEPVQHVLVSS